MRQPASLSSLCEQTRFTRAELKLLYRGFKNECPSGCVHKEVFREIFSQFFPLGDATAYADLVFNSFDTERRGVLTFESAMRGLSIICRGSPSERLRWAFSLYDADKDGAITKQEVLKVVRAIYSLLGCSVQPPVQPQDPQLHAERAFRVMDTACCGAVTFQQFAAACASGRDLQQELACFDTLL